MVIFCFRMVVKIHPHQNPAGSQNMEEFQLFHVGGALQQILPRCYGVAKCTIGQITYDLLFAERIAFTVEELFQKLQREAPNGHNVQLVSYVEKKNSKPIPGSTSVIQKTTVHSILSLQRFSCLLVHAVSASVAFLMQP